MIFIHWGENLVPVFHARPPCAARQEMVERRETLHTCYTLTPLANELAKPLTLADPGSEYVIEAMRMQHQLLIRRPSRWIRDRRVRRTLKEAK